MDDLISRQAAIDALGERPLVWNVWPDEYELGQRNQYDSDKLAIETLPSADRHGRWEWNNEDEFFYSCSNCGYKAYGNTLEIVSGAYNYCPMCGASMDEVEE